MYFQFLIEDKLTEILIKHVMRKLGEKYPEKQIIYNSKSFTGIGHLKTINEQITNIAQKLHKIKTPATE